MQAINKGQSIYEVVVAIGVITFALLAMIGLVISSIAATTYTRNKSSANRYTQEAMEWARNERNSDWYAFRNFANYASGGFCIGRLNWVDGVCAITGTSFERRIYANVISTNEIDVRIETSWSDERGTHVSESSTTFTNWENL